MTYLLRVTMGSDYSKILAGLKDTRDNPPEYNSKVLVIDALNTFIRNFSIINQLNPQGHHIGGLVGFLKSIGYAIRIHNPSRVIIVFDGEGSTSNKKMLYPEYKANRNLSRLTNWDIFDNKEEESAAMNDQMGRLINYLKVLPVSLISIDGHEADDVIGYIVKYFKEDPKNRGTIILSADQDFLQLVSDKVVVYSPTKKKHYKKETILEEYKVSAPNFIMYKTLMGDTSDNLPGVYGLGPKKLLKLFPELAEDKEITLDDILDKSSKLSAEHDLYAKIVHNAHQLDINHKLMTLHEDSFLESDINEINYVLENSPSKLSISDFLFMYNQDLLENRIPRVENWLMENFGFLNKF